MHIRANLQTARRRNGWWELLHISVYFQTALAGSGMSIVCVFPPTRILQSFKALRLKGRGGKKKGSLRDRIKGGGVPWKPGCSHQATSISSFKAWQGVVRSTEGSGGSGVLDVCGRNVRARARDPSVCERALTQVHSVHLPCFFLFTSVLCPQRRKQVTHFSHALS